MRAVKHVLVLAYYFPPDGGAGTQRVAKFVKYLREFGWRTTVVTGTPPRERGIWNPEDTSLLADVEGNADIVRVEMPEACGAWASSLPSLDLTQAWIEPAFETSLEIVQRGNIDAVLVTMSPFSLAYVGKRLQARVGVPVVYDLRDPWALDGWRIHSNWLAWRRDFRVMKETLTTADGVIANTPEAGKVMAERFLSRLGERMTVIPNGYDPADFSEEGNTRSRRGGLDEQFLLVHTGTLHSRNLSHKTQLHRLVARWIRYRPEPIQLAGRTPFYLLRALAMLRDRGHPLMSRLKVVFVGQADEPSLRWTRELGMESFVSFTGYLPHADSIDWLCRADALFLPLHGLPPGRRSLIVPGKTYEYIATGRPILGCLPDGDARDLVEATGIGFCADPCDHVGIADALSDLYAACNDSRNGPAKPASWIERYSRKKQTEQLASFLDRVVRMRKLAPSGRCLHSETEDILSRKTDPPRMLSS